MDSDRCHIESPTDANPKNVARNESSYNIQNQHFKNHLFLYIKMIYCEKKLRKQSHLSQIGRNLTKQGRNQHTKKFKQ